MTPLPDETKQEALRRLELGQSVKEVAKELAINKATIYQWRARGEKAEPPPHSNGLMQFCPHCGEDLSAWRRK